MSDLISRQAAIDATWKEPSYTDPLNVLTEVRDRIKALPSAEPERKNGKWIEPTPEGCFTHDVKAYSMCSECGKKEFLGWRKNFCPNCGADMRGEQDE